MLKSAGLACLDFSPTMQILKIFIREKILKERLIICSPVFQKQNRPEHRRWAGRAALVHRCSLHAGHASADHSTLWCTATSQHLGANLHPPPVGGRSSNKMTWGMLAGLYSKSFSYIHRACEGNFCPFFGTCLSKVQQIRLAALWQLVVSLHDRELNEIASRFM